MRTGVTLNPEHGFPNLTECKFVTILMFMHHSLLCLVGERGPLLSSVSFLPLASQAMSCSHASASRSHLSIALFNIPSYPHNSFCLTTEDDLIN